MKVFIVLAVLVAACLAAPVDDSQTVILKSESDVRPDGFEFEYKTSDGVSRQEQGQLKDIGGENPALQVQGSVTWTAADGLEYTLNYVANENGYQPEGAHLPAPQQV